MESMSQEIHSHAGVGPLRFGMRVDEVRSLMPVPAKSFVKAPGAAHPTDAFVGLGVHVFYNEGGKCEAIELSFPARPTLRGAPLLGVEFAKVERFLRSLGDDVTIDSSGATSRMLGVAVYCPGHSEDPTMPVEGVFAFEKGYYDSCA